MDPASRRRAGNAMVIVTAMAMLAVGGAFTWLRAALPSEPALISADDWSWSANGVAIVPIGDTGPFRDGDLVTGVGDRSLEAWAGDSALPGSAAAARAPLPPVLGLDVNRDGSEIRLQVPLVAQPVGRLLGEGMALLAYTLVQATVALLAWLRRPGEWWRRGFLLGSVGNIASAVIWELGLRPSDLARPEPMVLLFTLSAGLHLVFWSSVVHVLASWPWRAESVTGRPRVVAALYVLPQLALLAGVVLVMIGLVLAALARALLLTPAGRDTWLRIVIAACLAGALAVGLLTILPVLVIGHALAARSTVAALGLPLAVVLVIGTLRSRLFEVDVLLASRRRLVVAREEERRRLRRDLHDGIGPMLAAMTLKVDLARDVVRTDPQGRHPGRGRRDPPPDARAAPSGA